MVDIGMNNFQDSHEKDEMNLADIIDAIPYDFVKEIEEIGDFTVRSEQPLDLFAPLRSRRGDFKILRTKDGISGIYSFDNEELNALVENSLLMPFIMKSEDGHEIRIEVCTDDARVIINLDKKTLILLPDKRT